MRNLTTRTLLLATEGSSGHVTLGPAAESAATCIDQALILKGERITVGNGWINAATEGTASPDEIDALNRLIEREVAADRAEHGSDGLVLVPRRLFRYVEPELLPHVAAPYPEPGRGTADHEASIVSTLIRPATGAPHHSGAGRQPQAQRSDNGPRLQAIVAPDGKNWVAQAIEVDYAACGDDEADARRRFLTGLEATAKLHIENHGNLSRFLEPATTEIWTSLLESGLGTAPAIRIKKEAIDMRTAGLLFTSVTWIIVDSTNA